MVYWSRVLALRPSTKRPVNPLRRALPVLAVALAASAAACLDVGIPQATQVGFLAQSTHSDGGSGYVAIPEATFYANVNLVVSSPPVDSCFIAPVLAPSDPNSSLLTLDAGPVIFTRIGTREDTLQPMLTSGQISYRPRSGTRILFTPGDSIDITVPGAPIGFPSVITKARTSEEFTHQPVVVPLSAQDVPFRWTAAPQPGSRMVLSLRYANPQSSGDVNEQIYCGFVDDGSGTVPSALTAGWINALDGRRAIRATRLRTHVIDVTSTRRFSFISTFTLPLPSVPPGF